MTQVLSYFPGQTATIFLEVMDGYNHIRVDSLTLPQVAQIIFPDLTLAPSYPQNMTRIDLGLYRFQFTLPTGATAVGSYFVDVRYRSPLTAGGNSGDDVGHEGYQIIVNAPFGLYSTNSF